MGAFKIRSRRGIVLSMKYKGLLFCSIGSVSYQLLISMVVLAYAAAVPSVSTHEYILRLINIAVLLLFLYFLLKYNYWAYLGLFINEAFHVVQVIGTTGRLYRGYVVMNFVLSVLGLLGMVLNKLAKKKEAQHR